MKEGEDTLGIMSIPDQNYSHKKNRLMHELGKD